MTELGMNYDILIAPSINRLDGSIVTSLVPAQPNQGSVTPYQNQRGLTLVELMVAMLLGVFLIGGVLQIFISSKQTYRMQEGLSRLQENGRFAMDFITRDIRMAGFRGCSSERSKDAGFKVDGLKPGIPSNYLYKFQTFLEGFEATSDKVWSPPINMNDMDDMSDMSTINSPTGGSDVISIRRAGEQGFLVTGQADNNANLTLANVSTINKCDIAVVSDCDTSAAFQVSAIAGNDIEHKTGDCVNGAKIIPPGNAVQDLGKTYVGGQVFPINTITYFVSPNPGNNASLYRRIGSNNAEEVVEGVELMEILYGVDTDAQGTANYYVKANAVNAADWVNVVSVRISLLLATIDDNLAPQPAGFRFNDQDIPADRKLRRVFSSTIAVRNRLIIQ